MISATYTLASLAQNETKTFSDSWSLNLSPLLESKPPIWERLSKKGLAPSIRSGCASALYKNSMMVFGGVLDSEQDQHRVASVFYDDLFGLEIEKRKWYKVCGSGAEDDSEGWTVDKLRQNMSTYVDAEGNIVKESKKQRKLRAKAEAGGGREGEAEGDGDESSSDEEEESKEDDVKVRPTTRIWSSRSEDFPRSRSKDLPHSRS